MNIQKRQITTTRRGVGRRICEALGLDPHITGRIVIDVPVGELIHVYAELLGTTDLVDVIATINGPEIRVTTGASVTEVHDAHLGENAYIPERDDEPGEVQG